MADRILVIDDEKPLRLLYARELSMAGYQVDTAADAIEATAMFAKNKYALAIIDIEMPDMNGLELMGRLRRMAPGTRLVINSAYSTYRADFNSWLADGYILKSSDLTQLKTKIKELLVTSDQRK